MITKRDFILRGSCFCEKYIFTRTLNFSTHSPFLSTHSLFLSLLTHTHTHTHTHTYTVSLSLDYISGSLAIAARIFVFLFTMLMILLLEKVAPVPLFTDNFQRLFTIRRYHPRCENLT